MASASPRRFDLLLVPGLGAFLRWKHARTALQAVFFGLAALIVYDGIFGPQVSPKNYAGVLPWLHWRGFLVLALLIAGNLFCMACPFMLPRRLAKKLLPANRPWPARLQNKWLAAFLLLAFYWSYEAFDLWASPWLTAWIVVAFFLTALVIDGFFKGAAFCKYVCPIGQFNFVGSLVSPLEVKVRNLHTCSGCTTKDCIAGNERQNGCELWLYQPRKVGNFDCTFCLDCVQACPHDNVGLITRLPVVEATSNQWRSGIGRLSQRADIAVLVLVLTFGAFLNAFGMVGPVFEMERWIAQALGTDSEPLVLALVFALGVGVLPLVVVGVTSAASKLLSGSGLSVRSLAMRYLYALAPLGFGMWLAHYGFHFLIGFFTVVPLTQNFLAEFGLPVVGEVDWAVGPLLPEPLIATLESLLLLLGLVAALIAAHRIAVALHGRTGAAAWLGFAPWGLLTFALFRFGLWVLSQPMEMRGTFM